MTDARDEQEEAESLDPDLLAGDDTELYDDPEREFPPDRPLGATAYGTTAAEERIPEPLEERIGRELPDPLDEIAEPDVEELIAIEAEELLGDDDVDGPVDPLDVDEEIARERAVGRLVGPGADDDGEDLEDDEADAIASRVDEDDLTAEEEAVHLTDDPPYGEPGDGYIGEGSEDIEGRGAGNRRAR